MPGTYQFDDEDPQSLDDQGYAEAPDVGQSEYRQPEYREEPQQTEAVVDVDVDAAAEEPQEEDYQEVIGHVDRRLRIAQYFRLVLDGSLFGDDLPEARIVQNRIKKFARDEIEVLFGMKAAPVATGGASPFSSDEVEALKALAAATIAAKRRTPESPKLNRISVPQAPVVTAPALKPLQAVKQEIRPIVAAPVKPRQVAAKAPAASGPMQTNVMAGNPSLLNDPRIPVEFRKDPTVRVKNGRIFIQGRSSEGELLWVQDGGRRPTPLLKDVTPIAQPLGNIQPVPMPTVESMTILSEQKAVVESSQNLERLAVKLDPVFRGRVS